MARPVLLDIDKFCENLPVIESVKILNKKKFSEKGLFSEQIFGPLKNYTCQCGIYHGIRSEGGLCETCKIDIVNSSERRRRFAKIELPIPVINPIFYDLVCSLGGSKIKEFLNILMRDETSVLFWNVEEESYEITTQSEKPQGVQTWEKTEAMFELVNGFASRLYADGSSKWNLVLENIDKLFINNIIVLPPDLRPATKTGGKNKKVEVDKLNRFYVQILTKKEIMHSTIVDIEKDKVLYYNYFRQLQKDINELYDYILEKFSKKEGLIRGNILGKRIDFSGRAVIIPDPTLNIYECYLPYLMLLELYKLRIAKELVEINRFKLLNEAVDYVDECITYKSMILYNLCEKIIEGEVCILNRQPSLHRLGMLGFYIKITSDVVIRLHPLACPPFNADFDGDQMAVYIPISEKTKQEIIDKLLITKNLVNPANGSLTTTPSQDIILGIYALTHNKFPNLLSDFVFRGETVNEGIKIFNECFPDDFPIINKPLNGNDLISILNGMIKTHSSDEVAHTLDEIKKIGFKYATLFGATMSLQDCMVEGIDKLKEFIYEGDDITKHLQRISSDEITETLKKSFNYSYMIESGARGSWDQARQLILTRGYISNFKGQILPTPIKGNLIEGLSQKEFFLSTNGCRKGLLDVALNTGTSGYLSRKLIFSCANLQLGTNVDCGTSDYLTVYVNNLKKSRMLIYRFYKKEDNIDIITEINHKEMIGKTIEIRSPIFCKDEKICHRCYGDMHKHINSKFIGVIAAQSLGECNTQLVLRTFHTCLYKDTLILDINNKSFTIKEVYDIVKSGKSFYTFSCSPDGKIEVSKVIDAHRDRVLNKAMKITLDNNKSVECSFDHKWIFRNGSEVEAKDLKIGDSLMPIYFGRDIDGYRTIQQNHISKFHKSGRLDKVYHLSSDHKDSNFHHLFDENYKVARHHIDKNRKNDFLQDDHKIIKIEIIDLPNSEEFYDLTVDSKYENFALESGVFIHNSGVAAIKDLDNSEEKSAMKQQDIVNDLSRASRLLHKFDSNTNPKDLVKDLYDVYNTSRTIHHIHFESVISQLMWFDYKKWRLIENRDDFSPEYHSVQSTPTYESWLLALAFSNPKRSIIKGLVNSGLYTGIMDEILKGGSI